MNGLQSNNSPESLIGAIDQGTSSTRFLVFSCATGECITYHQEIIDFSVPQEGWAEHDPDRIVQSVYTCIEKAAENLTSLGFSADNIQAVGITNQRESLVVWDKQTGKYLHNAILWLDTRTADTVSQLIEKAPRKSFSIFSENLWLALSTYFTATKLRWLLDNEATVKEAYEKDNNLMVGTIDTWLIYNLTDRKVYATDVTNASRTMLMDIHRLKWSPDMCKIFGINISILPEIKSSAELFGNIDHPGPLNGKVISGVLGDQQAALVGQDCHEFGKIKNTYGTGCFILCNTGKEVVFSRHGLLTTVAYQLGRDQPVSYALEGSIASAGSVVVWLRENLHMFDNNSRLEELAREVKDTAGCYFVPALTGLLCPYWVPNARGTLLGLSQFTTSNHIALATLEAVSFQTKELLEAIEKDLSHSESNPVEIQTLRVDGGMVVNDLLMQIQANIAGVVIERPTMLESTSLGAAIAAAIGIGLDPSKMSKQVVEKFEPDITVQEQKSRMKSWKAAVRNCLDWESHDNVNRKNSFGLMKCLLLSIAVSIPSVLTGFLLGTLLKLHRNSK